MEKRREEGEVVGDCKEPLEEAGKRVGLSSKSEETLVGEDANTVENSDSDVSGTDEKPSNGGSATGDGSLKEGEGNMGDSGSDEEEGKADVGSVEKEVGSDDVEGSEAVSEADTERNDMECDVEGEAVKSENGASHESAVEEEIVNSAGKEVNDEKENCEVEDDGGGACDVKQKVETEKSEQSSVNGETISVAEDKADQEKGSTKEIEEDDNKIGVDSKQAGGSETNDVKHSESAQVPEESIQLSEGEANKENPGIVSEVSSPAERRHEEEITDVDQKEENGEAMEIDCAAAEEQEEKDVTAGGVLDDAGDESAGASMMPKPDVPIAEADKNDSGVVEEMEIDEQKDNADVATDLTGTTESAGSANPNSKDAATGEVEPLDHNALFDPSSDITNFIDFSGVPSWSGNQELKTETGNVSLKENKKPTDIAEEVATVDGNKTHKSVDATEPPKEAPDAVLGSENKHEAKDHQDVDEKTADQLGTIGEEDDITHESPGIDANQKEDTEMEENPSNSDYGTDSGIKTNGVKRKADAMSEYSPEGTKTVSFAKVSFAERPSFKIGACIARAASQMAGSPSVLKGGNVGDETLSVESFVSQLLFAAINPDKEDIVSEMATGFFLDFRNSYAKEHVAPEKVGSKRGRPSNAGGTEAFEFEEMGDTYWTDRVIHNGGEEQTTPTEKGYQVVPVELKPAQVQRTRRPYKRRKTRINMTPPASDKPAVFDENAPAELIMNFSETDTIPPEKSLSKMFRHFGPIRESQTEVDKEKNRARVVFRKAADAGVAFNCAGRFSIFGTKAVKYELSYTITETFKVQPYVVSVGEENAAACPTS